ncbi:hypothetical protein V1520DRAFT_349429 [Lipomyces starkeyi]
MDDKHPTKQLEPQNSGDIAHLSSYVLLKEHFANKEDFVAKLRVLSEKKPENSGYLNDYVFINENEEWIGHLFGTQYSLEASNCTSGQAWFPICNNPKSP